MKLSSELYIHMSYEYVYPYIMYTDYNNKQIFFKKKGICEVLKSTN